MATASAAGRSLPLPCPRGPPGRWPSPGRTSLTSKARSKQESSAERSRAVQRESSSHPARVASHAGSRCLQHLECFMERSRGGFDQARRPVIHRASITQTTTTDGLFRSKHLSRLPRRVTSASCVNCFLRSRGGTSIPRFQASSPKRGGAEVRSIESAIRVGANAQDEPSV